MKNKYIHSVLPLLVFAVFALSVLSVLLYGSKIYGKISTRDDTAFNMRTAAQYVSTKIRQTELQNAIRIEDFDGVCSIVLPVNYGTESYITRLYCYEGSLYELFSPEDVQMTKKDGEKLISLSRLSAEISDGILTVDIFADREESETFKIYLKSGEESYYEE